MNGPEKRTRGVVRISLNSIMKAIYGDTEYEAVNMRVSRTDKSILEITVSHPSLPEWRQGSRLGSIEITRRHVRK